MITLASNGRTPARGDNKQSKPSFSRDFTALERKAEQLDKDSVALFVFITKAFISDRDKTGVSLNAWCNAWVEQFPFRAVSTIRGHLTYTVPLADKGYDLSTFETMEHFRQQAGVRTKKDRRDDQKAKAQAVVKGKGKVMVKQYDSVLAQASALSKEDRKRLALAILATV